MPFSQNTPPNNTEFETVLHTLLLGFYFFHRANRETITPAAIAPILSAHAR